MCTTFNVIRGILKIMGMFTVLLSAVQSELQCWTDVSGGQWSVTKRCCDYSLVS